MNHRIGVVAGLAIALAGSAVAAEAQPQEYVLVGSGGQGAPGQVTSYRLDRNTGDLTLVDRKDVGGLASYIAAHPDMPVLYVTAERGGAMHWVRIDPNTGVLTPEGSQSGAGNPVYASVDATGRVLLGVNYGQGNTDVFPLDPATGAIAGAPTTVETGANSHSAVFHPNNRYVCVAAVRDSMITQYAFEGGQLRPLDPPSLAIRGGYRHITVHPDREYAYAAAGGTDNVVSLQIGGDGTLSSLGVTRRLPPEHADDAARHMGSNIEVTPDGRFAYVANRGDSNTLAIYSIRSDGTLELRGHESTRGRTPREFNIDPTGELLVVGNQDSQTVAVFRIDEETGSLTHLHTEEVGVNPWFVGVFRFRAR